MAPAVLVVDDSSMSRKITVRALPDNLAINVSQLDNGRDAVSACRGGRVDIMFLDLTMPGMSGFDVLEQLQGVERAPKVIVISADAQPKAEERAMELGAVGFARKPVDASALADTLRACQLL